MRGACAPAYLCSGLDGEWLADNGAWQGCEVDQALVLGGLPVLQVECLVCDCVEARPAKRTPCLSFCPFHDAVVMEAVGVCV